MRVQALVLGLLAACASTRAEGQAVAPKAAPPALAPGPHNVVLNGVRFFYSVRGGASDAVKKPDAIQDNVMRPRRERGRSSLWCDRLPFRSGRGARREKTKDQSLNAHETGRA